MMSGSRLPAFLPASLSALTLALAACTTVGPQYQLPEKAAYQHPKAQGAFLVKDPAVVSLGDVPQGWWKLYDDAVLNQLVASSLSANTDLRVAQAHLQRALSVADEVKDIAGPHAAVSASVERAQVAGEAYLLETKVPVFNLGDVGAHVSYQLDLFGQLARASEAAEANVQATEAAMDLVRVSVVGETVRAYLQVCAADTLSEVTRQALVLQQQQWGLASRMYQAGRGSVTDVERAQALVNSWQAELPRYKAERDRATFRLAQLAGQPPQAMTQSIPVCQAMPALKQPLPVGDGAALLKRRPDVRQAERLLAASTARIGVATADLYPSISLGAGVGLTGILDHLGQAPTQRWSIGPLISWHIPDSGARARVQAAEADQSAALAQFDGVVLNALRETETALSAYAHDLEQRQSVQASRQALQTVSDQNRRMVQAGRMPVRVRLDADQSVTASQLAVARANVQVAQDQLAVFMALGGGWAR